MNCHDIASRGIIGRQVFIEMHMIVEASDVETAHKITEEVEARLEARFNPVRVLIHIEPPDYTAETTLMRYTNLSFNPRRDTAMPCPYRVS
jgi:divalent metal cation (Fe/Co/Zn/Cd) transporter